MGVKLQDIILRKPIKVEELAGNVIAVDAPNIIMNLLGFSFQNNYNNYLIIDRTQRAISHLYGLLYRVNFFYSKNIFPIFCFDGRVSELKRRITKDQLNDYLITKRWFHEALKKNDLIRAKQIAKGTEFFWNNILEESKTLLQAIGVPCISSPASAEAQCAQLVKSGIADYVNSQDYDCLLFGCLHTVQNLSKSLRRKEYGKWTYQKIVTQEISLRRTLKNLGITRFQLIDLAILIGTDYFSGIKGIGSKTAYKLIKKHFGLERVLAFERKNYDFSNLSLKLVKKIRKIFLFPEVYKDFTKLAWIEPDKKLIINQLCYNHTLNKERVENNVKKLIHNYQKCRIFFIKFRDKPKSVQKTILSF
ncbi:MAG: hypothetical protein ACTSR8_14120 [Promethearchaeota archaeon]